MSGNQPVSATTVGSRRAAQGYARHARFPTSRSGAWRRRMHGLRSWNSEHAAAARWRPRDRRSWGRRIGRRSASGRQREHLLASKRQALQLAQSRRGTGLTISFNCCWSSTTARRTMKRCTGPAASSAAMASSVQRPSCPSRERAQSPSAGRGRQSRRTERGAGAGSSARRASLVRAHRLSALLSAPRERAAQRST